ncbi:hypothetical protein L6452_23191 [Arctium lappa]|uniref:Uncharacterized protein n=1 Tax=Arctium lappa TaxID=4217 RepID=A0ACB9B104_ARCLA|nr:hypothetical protein L6452_23191 [Arctium lappa]
MCRQQARRVITKIFSENAYQTIRRTVLNVDCLFYNKLLGDNFLLSIKPTMTSEGSRPPTASAPEMASCRRKKSEDATFLQDVKDHIDEFINASMDEHKTCFQKTISKMFGMSKVVAERNADNKKEVESSLPLRTVISD